MNSKVKFWVLVIFSCLFLAACNNTAMIKSADKTPDTLQITADGKMIFRDRILPTQDVIIYPDGFGGEKAAVKLYTPYHPPFYRDHIIVERLDPES